MASGTCMYTHAHAHNAYNIHTHTHVHTHTHPIVHEYLCPEHSLAFSHTDIVICLALDKPGERLITGSRDTTCAIWQFSSQVSDKSCCHIVVSLCLYNCLCACCRIIIVKNHYRFSMAITQRYLFVLYSCVY